MGGGETEQKRFQIYCTATALNRVVKTREQCVNLLCGEVCVKSHFGN